MSQELVALEAAYQYIYLFGGGILAFIVLRIILNCIITVSTNEVVLVEYLGKYSRTLTSGFHILLPFVESVKEVTWIRTIEDTLTRRTKLSTVRTGRISTSEVMFDFPALDVSTKDRIIAKVNGIMFFKIVNPYKAVYEISDLYQSMEQLVYTSMRDAISKITLDEAIEGKSTIKASIHEDFKGLENSWGVKLTKFDIQSIEAPESIQKSIEKLVSAQREAQAELEKTRALQEAKKLKIQTEQEIQLLECDAKNKRNIMEANTEAQVLKAKAESEAMNIEKMAKAEAIYLEKILSVKGISQEYLLQKEYTKSIEHLAKSGNRTFIIPFESAKYFGMNNVSSLQEVQQ
ncbi:predicted protein [Naegleria gruberi]|uniref:Predicted protein n=1 Tax=Naegleria gruberi TaxID=5762 RepID=D2VUQ9_NAEGR|nr:uncharacterized protein NAEGRDRAFT_72751 [Naegleria gruberi]EFC39495.1 predicted protein [Naegleria gruberi]|eukprot:XP_002672239.1 predicted protein [Naegleria gruberi strain NEG-M]